MNRCVFCQGELDESRRFCRVCGRMQPGATLNAPGMQGVSPLAAVQAAAPARRVRHCPTCQEVAYLEDRFCPRCSRPLRQPCPHCGTAAPIWGHFCPNCSLPLSDVPAQPAAASPARPAIGSTPPPSWGMSGPMPAVRPTDYHTIPAPIQPTPMPTPQAAAIANLPTQFGSAFSLAQPPVSQPVTPPSTPTPLVESLAHLPTQASLPAHDLAITDAPTIFTTPPAAPPAPPAEPSPPPSANQEEPAPASASAEAGEEEESSIAGLPSSADPDATITPGQKEAARKKPASKGKSTKSKKPPAAAPGD